MSNIPIMDDYTIETLPYSKDELPSIITLNSDIDIKQEPEDVKIGIQEFNLTCSEMIKTDEDISTSNVDFDGHREENIPVLYENKVEDGYNDVKIDTEEYKQNIDNATGNDSEVTDSGMRFRCKFCHFKTTQRYLLVRHFKVRHDEAVELIHCQFCDFKAKDKRYMTSHVNCRHKEKTEWLHCQFCDYKTNEKRYLKSHVNWRHNESSDYFQCSFCDYQTNNKNSFLRHFKLKHDESTEYLQCPFCDHRTKYKSDLKRHIKNIHHAGSIDWQQCELCDFKTKVKSNLYRHVKIRHTKSGE